MNRHFALMTSAVTILGLTFLSGTAISQQNSLQDQLVGAWTLHIGDSVRPDGSQTPLFGPNPNGIVTFDAGGHYNLEISRSNVPKLASGNGTSGTADENKTAAGAALAHSGTYTVEEAAHTLTFRAESSSPPNAKEAQQKWQFSILSADDLKWEAPRASGGGSELFYWKRVK
jgi:hypothetical protein